MARGKMWDDEDNAVLLEMKREGRTTQEIADALERTEAAVTLQLSKLKVKQHVMSQKTKEPDAFVDVSVEEYTEEDILAATKGADKPSEEPSCVSMPVIPVGDGKEHPLGKLPGTSTFVTLSRKDFDRTLRDAKTIKHTVEDLVSMLHSEENKQTEWILALGALLSDVNRLVEDLEGMKRGE